MYNLTHTYIIIPAKHPNSLIENAREFMQNPLRTHSEPLQSQFRIHPELIRNSSRAHSEVIRVLSRTHT